MSLDEFKVIFWWEWGHRFLGRVIGIAFAVPLLLFWVSGRIKADLGGKLIGLLGLGALQGLVGWYMVQSGLTERIDVSQYRLALHLSIAFLIFGGLVWLIADLAPRPGEPRLQSLSTGRQRWAYAIALLVFSQVAIGGFVAGLKAGRAFNTWPLMDGKFIPDGFLRLTPWWHNLTENMATVQFNHRLAAYAIVVLAIWHALAVWARADDERVRMTAVLLALGIVAQMVLGIFTVIHAVPISLGIAHQGFAAIVFGIAVLHAHAVARSARADA